MSKTLFWTKSGDRIQVLFGNYGWVTVTQAQLQEHFAAFEKQQFVTNKFYVYQQGE